jgi:SAM-dependent methyltransferase
MKMYNELATWWPLLSPPEDYEEEASFYARLMEEGCSMPLRTVLELGSGGGNNASYLKKRYSMVLVEPSAGMRHVSQGINPECEHVEGDMRTIRLGRQFDGVFVHDAVCYMTTHADLRRAIETAFVHTKPGGVALFAPDCVRETFRTSTSHGGSDNATHGLRYLEWTWAPDPGGTEYRVEYVLAMRTPDGQVRVEHDRHVEGLFSRGEWLRDLSGAGYQAEVRPLEHSDVDFGSVEVFLARRPRS